MYLRDILIAALSLFDVISGAVLALSYGYLMFPSAIGYLVGAIGGMLTGAVTPVSFMYESMALSWGQSKDFRDRISMIVYASILTGLLGLFGGMQTIVGFIGKEVFLGMLAGVGLYLAKVGLDIAYQKLTVGIPCFITAIIIQLLTDDLALTVSISVSFGVLLNYFFEKKFGIKEEARSYKIPAYKSWTEMVKTETKLVSLVFNRKVLIGTLALSILTIGGNIAYIAANSDLSNSPTTYNQSTVISSLADLASGLIGGANMELIITPTAAAPHPVFAGVLFMLLAAIILATGFMHKIVKWIPLSATGGYLFVIGALLILPYNAMDAFKAGNSTVVGLTIAVTSLTNPFFGILAGTLAKKVLGV